MGGLSVNDVSGIGAVSNLISSVIDRVWPDPIAQAKERADFLIQAQQLDTQLAQAQLVVNQAEASNSNIFVSGWRPFVGWVCGGAMAYHFIIQPLIVFICLQTGHKVDMPAFDMSTLITVLMAMLGMGTLHSVEAMGNKGNLPWQK
jgi:hypothetical protein